MNAALTLDDLITWIEAQPYGASVRLTGRGRTHTGHFSLQHTSHADGSNTTVVRVRDSARKRQQYEPVFERHIADGTLQIKVGARYRPAADVIRAGRH